MLLQMPVFFALYGAIRGAFEFRQAPFLYVSDLSRPDALLPLPFWPHQFNLLPILYAGLMLVQSFMTPLPKEAQARQQAVMMRFMPMMFFLFIYRMPSAFVLYFTASSIIGLIESWIIKRQLKAETAAAEAAGGNGNGKPPAAEADGKPSEPVPPPDPKAFWQSEGEKKIGQGKPRK
jgi:YidC/Oxa1 family membrane protein insertase